MMPSVLSTDPIISVPKCNWCTKRNDCNKRTRNVSRATCPKWLLETGYGPI